MYPKSGFFCRLLSCRLAQFFDGGLAWITTLGHDKNDYSEPIYMRHILQGIEFVASHCPKKKDYSKAYAKHRDDEVK